METVTRFRPTTLFGVEEHPEGIYVAYDDYHKLMTRIAELENQNSALTYEAEEAQCVHMCLDSRNVPRADDSDAVYSLWGRVRQYAFKVYSGINYEKVLMGVLNDAGQLSPGSRQTTLDYVLSQFQSRTRVLEDDIQKTKP